MEPHSAEDIFCDLMELPHAERVAALDAMVVNEPVLRAEVMRLLQDAVSADAYFTGTSVAVKMMPSLHPSSIEGIGDMVGSYQLVRKLGEGGFGVVWQADQSKPLKRTVAVKVIKAGMDSAEVLARFDAEKQALARMEHPNIAKVLDAGMTETGRPFFAMELVEGRTITQYCQEETLSTRDKLRLFADVCTAVNHAHQKGVIHRDIKPSNVLVVSVESKPVVKVIDFGIAKAIDGQLTDHTLRTRAEQWIGTPAYMSPEQTGKGVIDLDTRSDIYALGVILYELITGGPPFDSATLLQAGYEEMRRIIREEDPPRPSVRITTQSKPMSGGNSAQPVTTSGETIKSIASELDWIVMKAMDKSRERRYDTAAALADDVGRFLADEPVCAKPPTSAYLLSKFARRHRRAVQVIVTFTTVLITGVVFSSLQALRARHAERLAENRLVEVIQERNAKDVALQDAEAISRLLTEVFKRPNPEMDGRKVMVVDALDAAANQLNNELQSQPERHAMLLEVLAGTYDGLALPDKSLPLRQRVLEFQRVLRDGGSDNSLLALRRLIENAERAGNHNLVVFHAKEEKDMVEKMGDNPNLLTYALRSLARGYFRQERHEEAIQVQQQLIEHSSNYYGPLSNELSVARWELEQYKNAVIIDADKTAPAQDRNDLPSPDSKNQDPSKIDDAEAIWEKLKADHGDDHEETIKARMLLAHALWIHGQTELALNHQFQVHKSAKKVLGPLDTKTMAAQEILASMNFRCGKKEEAIRLQKQLIHFLREAGGSMDQSVIQEENQLERYYFYSEHRNEHIQFMRDTLKKRVTELGEEHSDTLYMRSSLILPCFWSRKFEEGLQHAEIAFPIMRRTHGVEYYATARTMSDMARCLASLGRTKEAVKLLEECCPHMRDDTWVNFMLANLQIWQGDVEGYNRTRRWMLDFLVTERGSFQRKAYILERGVWICCQAPLEDANQAKELLATLKRAREIREAPQSEPETYHAADVRAMIIGYTLYRADDFQGALDQFQEFERLAPTRKKIDPISPIPFPDPTLLAFKSMALYHLGRQEEANRTLQEASKILTQKKHKEEPLLGMIDAAGASLLQWIAYKEAEQLIR